MRLIGFLGGLSFLAACAMPYPAEPTSKLPVGAVWDTASEAQLDWDDLVSRVADADVVIIGELHDNAAHHQTQAWLVGKLRPAGLAFEMIPEASEEGIAVFIEGGGSPGEIGPAIGWEKIGWPDWAIYRPIFEAWTPKIYTGGAPGRASARRAIKQGAAGVVADDRFVPVLRTALDAETQSAMEDEMVASHCGHLPKSAAPGMVEAQRLRDASFAAAVLRARAAGGGQTVLITGNGHARTDRGVPEYLAQVAPDLSVVSIGLLESDIDPTVLDGEFAGQPFDFIWYTRPAEREDPCAVFKK